ncbi:MAG: hypothetical protein JXQ29_11270 [Planctomycetes bacterium]|nr:hypothetical protein [Planctomycetota bacterium]
MPHAQRLRSAHLCRLRNAIPVATLLAGILSLSTKVREGHLRFCCPLGSDFHPAIPSVPYSRCEGTFKPIELVMLAQGAAFLEAVRILDDLDIA